jgi:hypothetical protein
LDSAACVDGAAQVVDWMIGTTGNDDVSSRRFSAAVTRDGLSDEPSSG